MLCCLLAGLLALVGVKGHHRQQLTTTAKEMRYTRHAVARSGFGWCCGVLAFEVSAAIAAQAGGLETIRPGFLLVATLAVTALGAVFAWFKGTPTCKRAWILFCLGASAGSAVAELVDLHLLGLHRGPVGLASIVLHGLAVVPGIVAGRLLLQLGGADEPAAVRGATFAPRR